MRGSLIAAAIALAIAAGPSSASAQDVEPSGALTAHFLISDGDLGGAAMLDVWAAFEWLRVGGFFGGGAIPSERDEHNRVLMPFGVSVAAVLPTQFVSLEVRARAGAWGGATQAEKLAIGIFTGGGLYLGFSLGQGATIQLGLDVWGVIGSDAWRERTGPDDPISASTWVVAPGLGLSWTPYVEPPPEEEEP